MNDIVKGILGSLIASGLIALGTYLSFVMVPERTVLSYKVTQQKTSELSSWHLTLNNNSSIPFDWVKIVAPKDSLLATSYSTPSLNPSDKNNWNGKLIKGAELRILYFFSSGVVFSESLLKDLIKATYQERNDISGDWEVRSVEFDLGESSTSRIGWKIFWFLLPFIIASLLSFFLLYLYRNNEGASLPVDAT